MNLFRSEEHARNWVHFDEAWAHSIKPVAEWADIFSAPLFRERGRADYISWLRSEAAQATMGAFRARLPAAPS